MDQLILSAGKEPRQRTTKYGHPATHRRAESYKAEPLEPLQYQSDGVKLSDLLQASRQRTIKVKGDVATSY